MARKKKNVNKVCAKCRKDCKQNDKVIVQYCPSYEKIDKK